MTVMTYMLFPFLCPKDPIFSKLKGSGRYLNNSPPNGNITERKTWRLMRDLVSILVFGRKWIREGGTQGSAKRNRDISYVSRNAVKYRKQSPPNIQIDPPPN